MHCQPVKSLVIDGSSHMADPGVEVGRPRSSAEGASRVEAPSGVRCGEGVYPSPQRIKGLGAGAVPLPQKFFLSFWGQNGVFSCTLGAKFRFFSMTKTV